MARIVLEVDDITGKIYKNFPPESKQQLTEVVSMMLKKTVNDATAPDYKMTLDEISLKAVANGLTPEILAELLKSDD